MNRRSFLIGLGSAGLTPALSTRGERLESTGEDLVASYWDALDREEKMLRMAEHVASGTELERLVVTPADLNGAVSAYEQTQPDVTRAPFVAELRKSGVPITPSDVAAKMYTLSEEEEAGPAYPYFLDTAALAIPSGETDALVSAVTDWEDTAREHVNDKSTETLAHNRGLSRVLTVRDPFGYRIQRIRILDDRMLVSWVEGPYEDEQSILSGMILPQVEREVLLRRARTHLDAGNTIPEEPIILERSRWRK